MWRRRQLLPGFQAVNFADHRTPQEVRDSINSIRPLVEGQTAGTAAPTAGS